LDRGEPAGGVLQLALVREVGGIESAPPRLIGPPPDPQPDLAAHLNSPTADAPAEICSFAPGPQYSPRHEPTPRQTQYALPANLGGPLHLLAPAGADHKMELSLRPARQASHYDP